MKISALIVNYNSGHYTVNCIDSLQREVASVAPPGQVELEAIVVDNDSPQDQGEFRTALLARGAKWFDHGWNGGYSAGVNRAFRESTGELILVVNPDVEFLPHSLEQMVRVITTRPEVGAVGPNTWWDPDRQVKFPPNVMPNLRDSLFTALAHISRWVNRSYALRRTRKALAVWLASGEIQLDLLSGGCMLCRRPVWEELGGFDERYPLYFEDTDWFRRARQGGYQLWQLQEAHIVHFFNCSGVTNSEVALARYWTSRRRYFTKYYGVLGAWTERWMRALTNSSWAKKSRSRPMDKINDLGRVSQPPTLSLARNCSRLLIELTQDPGFFLAGAIFGAGDKWTPTPECWRVLNQSRYYLRAIDISGTKPVHLGTWTMMVDKNEA